MKQYIAIHNHKYGFTVYPFQSERDIYVDSAEEVAEKLGIDFDPQNDEDLTILSADFSSIPEI